MTSANVLIDSHCHFDFSVFDVDRKAIWKGCNSLGIVALLIPGVTPKQWVVAAQLCKQYKGLFYAAGIHPWWIEALTTGELNAAQCEKLRCDLRIALANKKCVAIGECGLDAIIKVPLYIQQQVLELQLQLACELAMPVIIHCRKAHNELIILLKKYSLPKGGVIHAFSGSTDLANSYWALGLHLGIGGSITYERAQKTRAAIKQLPIEAILLETDAPDMPLSGQQGQRNSPEYLPRVAQALADLRNEALQYVIECTTQNARNVFGFI